MSHGHAQTDLQTDLRNYDGHSRSHEHISEARGEVFEYGKNLGALKSAGLERSGSVERDGTGNPAALTFDHNHLYGQYSAAADERYSSKNERGADKSGFKSAGTDDERGKSEEHDGKTGKGGSHPSDRSRSMLAAGDNEQTERPDSLAKASDQSRGSLVDYGNGRKEYSEHLPDNWGSMSDLERQAWRKEFQKRSNEALGIRNEPRLGVDPETGIWMGYAGEQPTEAEKEQMRKIENDPRRPHAV